MGQFERLRLGGTPDPSVRLVFALIWAFWFLVVAFHLWRRRPYVRRTIPLLLALYASYDMILGLVFATDTQARSGLLLKGLFFVALILFSWWSLNRPSGRAIFPDAQSPEQENGPPFHGDEHTV
ncbi:MAG: hypothetical protein ACE5E7_04680 [Anaerolineae bacterium]